MDTVAAPTRARLAQLARASFVATLASAGISLALLLAQADIFLLHHPPAIVGDLIGLALKVAAGTGTALGVLATIAGFVLRRISKRTAQAEQRRERVSGIVGAIADELQAAPEQIGRLRAGLGCAFPLTVTVLGISVVVATITYAPSQGVAAALNNPVVPAAQGGTGSPATSATPSASPSPTVATGTVKTYANGLAGGPRGVAFAPDGALWYTTSVTGHGEVGRVAPDGSVTHYKIPVTAGAGTGDVYVGAVLTFDIVAGPDGAMWLPDAANGHIFRIDGGGAITTFNVPTPYSEPTSIARGPDGALWFTETSAIDQNNQQIGKNQIGRITVGGAISAFPVPSASSELIDITSGPDGALWFTEIEANRIGRITTGGAVSEFAIPTPSSFPNNITSGPDGALWFTELDANQIGRITTGGAITEFAVPTAKSDPNGIVGGPDGAVWFTERAGNQIGRITPSGAIKEFPLATPNARPGRIIVGPDKKLYFSEAVGQIESVTP